MSLAVYGQSRCPSCSEEIAAKSLAFSCGSCGQTIQAERRCGGPRSLATLLGFGVMLMVLGAYADFESSRMHQRARNDVEWRLQSVLAANRELQCDLARTREALRHSEARERCGLARISWIKDQLADANRQRDEAVQAASQPEANDAEDALLSLDLDDAPAKLDLREDDARDPIGDILQQLVDEAVDQPQSSGEMQSRVDCAVERSLGR